jgi:hypothetical protein
MRVHDRVATAFARRLPVESRIGAKPNMSDACCNIPPASTDQSSPSDDVIGIR